jgi:alpha-L-arabinofuranosidase
MSLTKDKPLFIEAPNQLQVKISDAGTPVSVINCGYWGMGVTKNDRYRLRFYVRAEADYQGTVTAKVLAADNRVLASQSFKLKKKGEWNEYTAMLTATATDGKAKLALEFNATGTVWIDYVSLFPEKTFRNRPNGLRKDVAELLEGLHPAFMRWPGGCVVEGITLDNRFEWKKMLGDPARRPGCYDTWGYRCSYGFGYHEFLQFCEDIGAGGMFVCNAGMACTARMGDICEDKDFPFYVDDALDAIEYALGGANTEWGAKRVAAGHPKPFPLKYIEIGNENGGKKYEERFRIFYKAIKEKYPQLEIVSNNGLGNKNPRDPNKKTDLVDPHYYRCADYFFFRTHIMDDQLREDYKVYVGEYSCNRDVGDGNMLAALSEAAFITGLERNGDLVTMTSYSPPLMNRNDRTWPMSLIWISSDSVVGRTSYYVQKMYSENKPTYNLPVELEQASTEPELDKIDAGAIGFGTRRSQAEFKDVKVTTVGNPIATDTSQWDPAKGKWTQENGVWKQNGGNDIAVNILRNFTSDNFTLEMKARKLSGQEGFAIYFGLFHQPFDLKRYDGWIIRMGTRGSKGITLERFEKEFHIWSEWEEGQLTEDIEIGKWYDVRVTVSPSHLELWMDGVSVYKHSHFTSPRNFAVAGYDETSKEIIVKVVNAKETPFKSKVNLNGIKGVVPDGRIITLAADNITAENSFANPLKIVPKETPYHQFGTSFEYTFKPNSFTILRIKSNY